MRLTHRSIAVTDRSSVGEVRRTAMTLGQALDFDEQKRSNIGIVATELANNVVLHAAAGEILLCPSQDEVGTRLDIIALDKGPGIRDIGQAMEDGYSSSGTPGQGLGAVRRISDESALYSVYGQGTAHWSRFQVGNPPKASVINVPIAGEVVAGDSYLLLFDGSRSIYMMVDGLGHGPGAAEAAEEAVLAVKKAAGEPIAEVLLQTHEALKKTRGAAMAIAIVDRHLETLTFAGVGNIGALLLKGDISKSLVSQNGTLGAVMPRHIQETTFPMEREMTLVLFSDGLTSRTSTTLYSGHHGRPGMLLAGLMYRDFSRRRDDASVLLARLGGKRT